MATDEEAGEAGVVVYDFLHCRGGAEKVALTLLEAFPVAELCVGYRNADAFPLAAPGSGEPLDPRRLRDLGIGARFRGARTLLGGLAFRTRTGFLRRYDWAIFSGSVAVEGVYQRLAGRNIYYCHTLPRFAYDLQSYYQARTPPPFRPALNVVSALTRWRYPGALARMDRIVANSETVRARLDRYLGVEAQVIHPPCDVAGFQWLGQDDYYLSMARLEPYKRVDLIIKAFLGLPKQRLVIASTGSDEQRLRALAGDALNIAFVGRLDDASLRDLTGRCIATLYVARDEDFGMAPVESMAAGKPVIGVAEGGLLETVVHGQTGLLIDAAPPHAQVREAVAWLSPERARRMRAACESRARLFSVEQFVSAMRAVVDGQLHAPDAS